MGKCRIELTIPLLRQLLDYDPDTGIFTWAVDRSNVKAGTQTGRIAVNGYIIIRICGKARLAHRLAWMHFYQEDAPPLIDHINGNKTHNSIHNLRSGTKVTNGQNRRRAQANNMSSGLLGVSFIPHVKKFTAYIDKDGTRTYLGWFEDKNEAHAAYLEEKRRVHEGCTI
jgi:hypothetical protein